MINDELKQRVERAGGKVPAVLSTSSMPFLVELRQLLLFHMFDQKCMTVAEIASVLAFKYARTYSVIELALSKYRAYDDFYKKYQQFNADLNDA